MKQTKSKLYTFASNAKQRQKKMNVWIMCKNWVHVWWIVLIYSSCVSLYIWALNYGGWPWECIFKIFHSMIWLWSHAVPKTTSMRVAFERQQSFMRFLPKEIDKWKEGKGNRKRVGMKARVWKRTKATERRKPFLSLFFFSCQSQWRRSVCVVSAWRDKVSILRTTQQAFPSTLFAPRDVRNVVIMCTHITECDDIATNKDYIYREEEMNL